MTAAKVHMLYRFFDHMDELLYVGITSNPAGRWKSHSEEKEWWADVAHIKTQLFDSREALAAAEVEAIRTEKPRHNIVHNSRTTPRETAPTPQAKPNAFIGRAFHTWKTFDTCDCRLYDWQGIVVAKITDTIYLVGTFSWGTGDYSTEHLVTVDQMLDWTFYPDTESMVDNYRWKIADERSRTHRAHAGDA